MLNRELGLISHLPFSQPVVNIPWNDTKTFKKSNLFHFILNIIVFPMPSALMSQQKEKKNVLHKAGFIYKGSHTLLTARSNITTAFWNNFRYIIGKIIHSPYPQVCSPILCFYASWIIGRKSFQGLKRRSINSMNLNETFSVTSPTYLWAVLKQSLQQLHERGAGWG